MGRRIDFKKGWLINEEMNDRNYTIYLKSTNAFWENSTLTILTAICTMKTEFS